MPRADIPHTTGIVMRKPHRDGMQHDVALMGSRVPAASRDAISRRGRGPGRNPDGSVRSLAGEPPGRDQSDDGFTLHLALRSARFDRTRATRLRLDEATTCGLDAKRFVWLEQINFDEWAASSQHVPGRDAA